MEVFTLRIAAPFDLNAPNLRRKLVRPQQIPFVDLALAFQKALTVPYPGYRVATVAGKSSRSLWSLDAARHVLGYEPSVDLDQLGLNLAPDPFGVQAH
jgi:hypothetical protein